MREHIRRTDQKAFSFLAHSAMSLAGNGQTLVLIEKPRRQQIIAFRGRAVLHPVRSEYGKRIRKDYEAHKITVPRRYVQKYDIRNDGKSNALTTVQKDNLIMEYK